MYVIITRLKRTLLQRHNGASEKTQQEKTQAKTKSCTKWATKTESTTAAGGKAKKTHCKNEHDQCVYEFFPIHQHILRWT